LFWFVFLPVFSGMDRVSRCVILEVKSPMVMMVMESRRNDNDVDVLFVELPGSKWSGCIPLDLDFDTPGGGGFPGVALHQEYLTGGKFQVGSIVVFPNLLA
jgi:hypothetical protein